MPIRNIFSSEAGNSENENEENDKLILNLNPVELNPISNGNARPDVNW